MDLLGEYEEESGDEESSPKSHHDGSESVAAAGSEGLGTKKDEEALATGGKSDPKGLTPASVGIRTEHFERLRNASAPGTPGASMAPSDVSSPASQNGDTDWAQASEAGRAVHGQGEMGDDLPAAPPGPVDEAVRANIERLVAQRKQGADLNKDLQDKKEFHNPGILERLVSDFKIRQSGTNYHPDIFSPIYPPDLYYDALARQAEKRDALHRATRTSIGFESAGVQKPPDYPSTLAASNPALQRPIVQHLHAAAPTLAAPPAAAVAAAAAAAAVAAAVSEAQERKGLEGGGYAMGGAHVSPAGTAEGAPVKKKSKWDTAIKAPSGAGISNVALQVQQQLLHKLQMQQTQAAQLKIQQEAQAQQQLLQHWHQQQHKHN